MLNTYYKPEDKNCLVPWDDVPVNERKILLVQRALNGWPDLADIFGDKDASVVINHVGLFHIFMPPCEVDYMLKRCWFPDV
jgi:hypothetical protein